MEIYLEWYHFLFIFAGMAWGMITGWALRGDCNNEKLLDIQLAHMKELFKTRKARLCDLMGLPLEGEK